MTSLLFNLKRKRFFIYASLGLFGFHSANAQDITNYGVNHYEVPHPIENCITENQRVVIAKAIEKNRDQLRKEGKLQERNSNLILEFSWPIDDDNAGAYEKVWAISNYLDHNPNTNQLEDWNCGTRTYDTTSGYDHSGVDIFNWPFSWKLMDESRARVIAAAAGQIIYKNDGSFDRNCDFNNDLWNAVYIEHADGSIAWYGHLKNNSVTTKNVGDFVEEGEYLGVVGSSGNSTGPHLHFEVYDENNNLIDPYQGPCNNLNSETWWADQKPYLNTGISAVLTHTAAPDFGDCPDMEITYEENNFDLGDQIFFGSYFTDQVPGTTIANSIIDPNGNVYANWNNNVQNPFYASWWLTSGVIDNSQPEGVWTYRVVYNGETVDHDFGVGVVLDVQEEVFSKVKLYPNPAKSIININANDAIKKISIYNMQGQRIDETIYDNVISISKNISSYPNGLYFTVIETNTGINETIQFLKE